MRVCRVKNWYFSLKDSEYKIQKKKKKKKPEHSEIKQYRRKGLVVLKLS